MKYLGIYLVVAISYLVTVLAGPAPSVYINDKNYEYYAQQGFTECYVTSLTSLAKKSSKLTFEPYVTDSKTGIKYNVGGLMADLTGSVATTIEVPSTLRSSFSISDNILKTAKKLKSVRIASTKDVNVFDNTFNGVSTDINIYGKGVDKMLRNYAKKFLQYNYPDLITDYSKLSEYDTRIYLYNVAKIVKDFKIDLAMKYGDNGAVALFLKQGTTLGISRAVRYLAIASGYSESKIIVAGDDIQHGFCLVKLNSSWYVYDAVKGYYNDRSPWSFFQTMNGYINGTLNPYYGRLYKSDVNTFVKYNAIVGCKEESFSGYEKENLVQWLSKNNKGNLA
ncbi:hypothetical protein BCR36DRAFT_583698 [Piromyces finnis]|uniref:Transglutaminase-like domain-containing protein n=1 Tax=Piromyces finnis TaxID=1754191 RepID=A0A1Y1V828_9FUNG|nr:hypothetical protein BCR36DRAFT_583698 [Piromyces finnis]|eukprot:ORX49617.1 hypothetical protein BCR36DRAFT_583698 [Piromyces finnis]